MLVLVDTTVWSLALRRRQGMLSPPERAIVVELDNLITEGRVRLLGLVRQELLSGIREHGQYDSLRRYLRSFPDVLLEAGDHELAAEVCNGCRRAGIATTTADALVCAVASARSWSVFTTDADFKKYQRVHPIELHTPRRD